ncbi:MAG: hypothetical protein V2A70_10645 [Candidatus Omnitrophota bacterium]
MIRKIWYILGLAVFTVLLVVAVFQTTWLSTFLLRRVLSTRPGVIVREVSVGGQYFSFPGQFHFQSVKMVLSLQGKDLSVDLPSVDVSGLQQWFGADRRFLVDIKHAYLKYAAGICRDLNVHFTVVPQGVSGPVSAGECLWDKWRALDASSFMIVNATGVEVRALKFTAYDGHLAGKVVLRMDAPQVEYSGEIFMEGVNVVKLGEVSPAVMEQLDGVVTGTVSFKGDPVALQILDAALIMPEGGNVSAALLSALTQYLPVSREKKRLDALISRGGKLGMELFSFSVKGGLGGKFAGELHLRSREINLELNLTHEINTDGTMASLLAYGQKFIQ